MSMLSDDDLDIRNLSDEALARAWDLWFDLAQATNDSDPAHTHGVFQLARVHGQQHGGETVDGSPEESPQDGAERAGRS